MAKKNRIKTVHRFARALNALKAGREKTVTVVDPNGNKFSVSEVIEDPDNPDNVIVSLLDHV